jgi:hypothetical protein
MNPDNLLALQVKAAARLTMYQTCQEWLITIRDFHEVADFEIIGRDQRWWRYPLNERERADRTWNWLCMKYKKEIQANRRWKDFTKPKRRTGSPLWRNPKRFTNPEC